MRHRRLPVNTPLVITVFVREPHESGDAPVATMVCSSSRKF